MPDLGNKLGPGPVNFLDHGFEGLNNSVTVALNHGRSNPGCGMDRLDFGDDKADSAPGLGAPVVFMPSGGQAPFAESGEMGGAQDTVSDREGPDSSGVKRLGK